MNEFNNSHASGEQEILDKDVGKELAVKDERHWVRLTRLCNQRCQFCLDSWNHNGTYVDSQELLDYIRKGREDAKTRLILSGGEPTIHPDFVRFVRHGRQVGYRWVQTVTNGMLFAYPKFARAAVRAGLNEATFSIHGHTPKIQDSLTGTPGAFDKAIQGIRNLQQIGGVVINIDIVINKQNYKHLREMLDFFMGMGIKEFDLLYIIPFGRGFTDYRRRLFFDLDDDAYPYFQEAFEVSKMPGVYLWTNRLPVRYLENYEHLIQDPHKLHYEINGGRHNFEGLARWGVPPDCYGERCDHCFLAKICRDTLMPYQQWLKEGGFERIKVHVGDSEHATRRAEALLRQQSAAHWIVAGDTAAAATAVGDWSDRQDPRPTERVAELTDGSPPAATALSAASPAAPIDRWVVRGPEAVAALLEGGDEGPRIEQVSDRHVAAFEIVMDQPTVAWLLDHPERLAAHADRVVLTLRNHEYLSESREADPTPEQIRALAASAHRFRNVPECMTGHAPEGCDRRVLDDHIVDDKGLIDLDAYVHHYVVEEYYSKSTRCSACPLFDSCEGVHINYIRNHGYKVCQPLERGDETAGEAPRRRVAGGAG